MSMRKIHSDLASKLKDSKEYPGSLLELKDSEECSDLLTDKNVILSLLKDEKQVNKLEQEQFLELITATEETTKFALSSPCIRKKLNELPIDESVQTFNYSCAAYCILKMLSDLKLIDKSECTRTKELEIYSQIWKRPGDVANPIKIYQFLEQLGLDVSITEIEKRIQAVLPVIPDEMKFTYSFIHDRKELKKASYDEKSIPTKDKSFLLIAVCEHGIHFHVMYAKCKDDKFIVFSPSAEETKHQAEFHSFADFFTQNSQFTGLMYTISNPKKLELTVEKQADQKLKPL